jgi:predicted Zn-dependent protease
MQQLAAQLVAGGAMARFSRAAESEADALGTRFMNDAGYNARGMVTMFQTLMSSQRSKPGAVERFFSTHPLTEDRIRGVEKQIAGLPQRNTVTDEAGFRQLKSAV